jgi:protoheme IX farnesyltransferase
MAASSALSRVDGQVPVAAPGWRATVDNYLELTKPRIIVLLLVTAYTAMLMAQRGLPPLALTIWTLLGGALASASGGVFNCVWDRDIDGMMRRTAHRPVAAGRVGVRAALAYATILGGASFAIFYLLVNPLAAWLSLGGNLFYVLVYTMWLKRATPLNIVIGGAAGAVPPLVGWAAVTHSVGWPALGLFALVFLWTPPHFWALALMTETDYDKANIPMFPNVYGVARTKREILGYSVLMVAMSLALYPLHILGPVFFGAAAVLGAIFLRDAWRLFGDETTHAPRALFKFSLVYLALMCLAMIADQAIRWPSFAHLSL